MGNWVVIRATGINEILLLVGIANAGGCAAWAGWICCRIGRGTIALIARRAAGEYG